MSRLRRRIGIINISGVVDASTQAASCLSEADPGRNKMTRDEKLLQDIQCVEFYLADEFGVMVDFDEGGQNEYWFDPGDDEDTGVISIDSSMDLLEQLYVLLHEAGHVKIRTQPDFMARFPDSNRHSLSGRIEILREEVAAWNEAALLIDKFGIARSRYFNETSWRNNYRDALSKYAQWVATGDTDTTNFKIWLRGPWSTAI